MTFRFNNNNNNNNNNGIITLSDLSYYNSNARYKYHENISTNLDFLTLYWSHKRDRQSHKTDASHMRLFITCSDYTYE